MESHHMHTWIPVGIALILVAGCGRTTSMKRDDVDAGLAGTQSDANTDRGDIEGIAAPMDVTVSDTRIADAEPLDPEYGNGDVWGDQWGDMLAVDASDQSDGGAPDVSPQLDLAQAVARLARYYAR